MHKPAFWPMGTVLDLRVNSAALHRSHLPLKRGLEQKGRCDARRDQRNWHVYIRLSYGSSPRLPPLAAVRAFEAAARLGSFTRAGEELAMSQAAVSYQIKLLEERLGLPLFLRQARQVVLTESGRQLAAAVTDAFDSLRAAFAAVRAEVGGVLTISAVPAFAPNWLAPRIGAFQLATRASPSGCRPPTSCRLRPRGVDVAIRCGRRPVAGACRAPPVPGPVHAALQPGPAAARRPARRARGPVAPAAAEPRRPLVAALVRAGRRRADGLEARPGIDLELAADRRPRGAGRPGRGHADARRSGPTSSRVGPSGAAVPPGRRRGPASG